MAVAATAVIGVISSVIGLFTGLYQSIKNSFAVDRASADYSKKLAEYAQGIYTIRELDYYNYKGDFAIRSNWRSPQYFKAKSLYRGALLLHLFDDSMKPIGIISLVINPSEEIPDAETPGTGNRSLSINDPNYRPNYGDDNNGYRTDTYVPSNNDGRSRYFSFGNFNNFLWDLNPLIVQKIRENRLTRNDWFFCSESPLQMLWTPNGWILSPTTGYDYFGNFYYLDEQGNANMLQAFDKPIPDLLYSEPTGSRYSTFSGTSVRNWYESLQVLEQEKKASAIQAREAEAQQQLLTEKETEEKQYRENRSLYLRNGLITVGVLTGAYFIYKFIKKRKKL